VPRLSLSAVTINAVAVFAAVSVLLHGASASAQTEPSWANWDSVQRFRGVAEVKSRGWRNWSNGFDTNRTSEYDTGRLTFVLERVVPDGSSAGSTDWVPAEPIKVQGAGSMSISDESWQRKGRYKSHYSFAQALSQDYGSRLSLNHETGEFELLLSATLDDSVPESWTNVVWRYQLGTEASSGIKDRSSFASANFYGDAPHRIGPLTATVSMRRDAVPDDPGDMSSETVGKVALFPEWQDFKVVVTVEGHGERGAPIAYEKWRPLGSIKEPGTPGNYLVVRATLEPVDETDPAKLPEVESFAFELKGTSQEPGVAMNWPKNASDDAFDLRIVPLIEYPGILGDAAQSLVIEKTGTDDAGRPTVTARIDSLDFGGRTDLHVAARLGDGREIHGQLESGDGRYDVIQLPKRLYGEWVADGWKEKNDVTSLADDDDEEDKPEGDGDNGDGLVLYEEYRGFAARQMRGNRVEGDPKKKDLFVLNLIGPDAWEGIDSFESATEIRVVEWLEQDELDPQIRVINGNFLDAPHKRKQDGVVYQHGIVLKTLTPQQMGHHGAEAFGVDPEPPKKLKPRSTRYIGMPARNDPNADLNKPYNADAASFSIQYDRTVVHEMLHSVSVAHHGEGDDAYRFRYVPKAYREFTMPSSLFSRNDDRVSGWVDVRDEATGRRFADMIGPAYDQMLERLTAEYVAVSNLPAETRFADLASNRQWRLISRLPPFFWQVGVDQGQGSGNELCPMRYVFAEAYVAKPPVRTLPGESAGPYPVYYLVPQDSNRSGVDICELADGTGVNAPDRKPQSRFGPASAGRGACALQICLNDAMPDHDWDPTP
jgi:hypothetical protein